MPRGDIWGYEMQSHNAGFSETIPLTVLVIVVGNVNMVFEGRQQKGQMLANSQLGLPKRFPGWIF